MTGLIWELPLFKENLKDIKCTYQKAKDTLKKLRNEHFIPVIIIPKKTS